MSLRVIDRFHPDNRRQMQQAIDAGKVEQSGELELLAPEQMKTLAFWGLIMFVIGVVFFVALNVTMYLAQTHKTSGSIGGAIIVWWLVINLIGSVLILGVHEGIHGIAFTLWGGKPYYGAKLPFAFFCSTKAQLFPRNYYLVVGIAPLVVITVGAIIFTIIAPIQASYGLLAWISNFSGAVGDVFAVLWLLRQPKQALIEDTETGCRAWMVNNI